ncbi:MAG TPA: MBG domain-containing protein [Pirellulales bacterium]|nr:MBG domain-containing protein [Pirellulales bacterium]
MVGGTGNSSLYSSGGSSITLFGGTGNDTLGSSGGTSVSMYGGSGGDTLSSTGGTTVTMVGGTGNSSLYSSGGSSITLFGGTGSDTLGSSGGTSVSMYGGSGNDTLSSTGGTTVTMVGGTGNSSLYSSGGSSITMFGGTGNDTLSGDGGTGISMYGGTGNDTLLAGSSYTMTTSGGTETLYTSAGSSITMFGGSGNDSLGSSGGTSVSMYGGSGSDTLSSTGGTAVTMVGGTGSNSLYSSGGSSITMFGGTGNDTLSSTGGTNVSMYGGSGTDSLSAGGTSTTLSGSGGTVTMYTSGGSSISMFGGTGNDTLGSTGGTSVSMYGGTGNDTLLITGGTASTLVGGTGTSSLYSSGGSSITLFGGSGTDTLGGTGGTNISLYGGSGNDLLSSSGITSSTLVGGTGNDTMYNSGGSSITLFGGTGNDTLGNTGGTAISVYGGTGNDTLTNTGGTSNALVGGTGNSSLYSSGGSSITLFGGSGNDTLGSSANTSISIIGGGGNDTLTSTGDTNATVIGGGTGANSMYASGGTGITMFGGSGNDTLGVADSAQVELAAGAGNNIYSVGGSGNTDQPAVVTLDDVDTYGVDQADSDAIVSGTNTIEFGDRESSVSLDLGLAGAGLANQDVPLQQVTSDLSLSLIGQFQNVIGTAGNDSIVGGSGHNILYGGSGEATLVGGSGPATLVAGTGNDWLGAGTGGTTFRFSGSQFGSDTVDPPGGPDNTLDFSQFGGPVTLNLGSTVAQVVSKTAAGLSMLTLTLDANAAGLNPDDIAAAIDSVIDSPYNDSITGNSAGNRFFVGAGNDTFTGGGGSDTFFFSGSQLGSDQIDETSTGNTLDFLGMGGPVDVNLSGSADGAQVTSPAAAGTNLSVTLSNPNAFDDVIGTRYGDTLQAGSGDVSIYGAGGNDSLFAGTGNDYIQGNVEQVVYLDFSHPASTVDWQYSASDQAGILARLAQDYADFNYEFTADPAQAAAWAVSFGGQYTTFEINQGSAGGASNELDFGNVDLGGVSTINVNPFLGTAAGLVAPTDANVISLTAEIVAHELGHQSGLRHSDAFGPIGTGVYGTVASLYGPSLPAASGTAPETPQDIMASPASVDTTLAEAAGLDADGNPTQQTYFGARDDIKLAFNDDGTVLNKAGLPTLPAPSGLAAKITQTYQIGNLPQLAVPNTIADPTNVDFGKTFDVTAVAVNGALTMPNEQDFYAFQGTAGELMNFQAISNTNTSNPHPFFTELVLLDASGDLLDPIAYNLHDFESTDSSIVDVTLPSTGTYYIGIDAYAGVPQNISPTSPGDYQLFMYSFATTAGTMPATSGGDTMVGGAGGDTFVASAGNDLVNLAPGNTNPATIYGGSGQTTVNANGDVTPIVIGGDVQIEAFTTTSTITWATPVDITYGTALSDTQLDATANVSGTFAYSLPAGTVLHAGDQTINVTFTPTDTTDYSTATASVILHVDPAALTIAANDQVMTYGGTLPALTVTYNGLVNGDTAATFGTSPNVTPTVAAPSSNHVGTYAGAIVASGASDPDYTISYVAGTLTVTPAALTITANDQTMVYGGTLPTLTVTYAGLVNGDTPTTFGTSPNVAPSINAPSTDHVGTHNGAIVASGASDPDYTISYVAGDLTVTPAALTITANSQTMVYGGTLPTLTVT